jgi:uncharacterized membrane protein
MLHEDALADWAARHGQVLVLRVRPGEPLYPGQAVAHVSPGPLPDDADTVLRDAMACGPVQAAAQDLEFAVRQLVEVALRALSPGIKDPFTAMAVLDWLGDALTRPAPRHLPDGVIWRGGRPVLYRPAIDYAGLCDAMFHMIRQNAAGSAGTQIRLLDMLDRALTIEHDPARRLVLCRHAGLAHAAGRQGLDDPAALADLDARLARMPCHR